MEACEIEKCIDRFGTDIYRFCLKLCICKSDAEDLYQQTFLKALESDFNLDWNNNPRALFFSLTHNLWKSDIRKNSRRAAIAPSVPIDEITENQMEGSEDIEGDYVAREKRGEINRIIESLPEKIRIPLTLYYFFDYSTEEVAAMIKKPPGTVKSRLFKGRSLIKKRLEELNYG